jgi:hypothetical protein
MPTVWAAASVISADNRQAYCTSHIVNFLTDSPTAVASNILADTALGAQTRHLSGAERAKNC